MKKCQSKEFLDNSSDFLFNIIRNHKNQKKLKLKIQYSIFDFD